MPTRVLVVDDAVFMRNMLKEIFSSNDFDAVGEASNGIEAVEQYKKLQPDVTTMDIVMPHKSGIDATREIMELSSNNAVVVMCSALGQEPLVMEAIEAGATDFIVKPFKSDEVLRVVRNAIVNK